MSRGVDRFRVSGFGSLMPAETAIQFMNTFRVGDYFARSLVPVSEARR